jgi:hypothetical protein
MELIHADLVKSHLRVMALRQREIMTDEQLAKDSMIDYLFPYALISACEANDLHLKDITIAERKAFKSVYTKHARAKWTPKKPSTKKRRVRKHPTTFHQWGKR